MSICARSGSSNCLIPFGFTQNFVALLQFDERKCYFNLLKKPKLAKFKTKHKQKRSKVPEKGHNNQFDALLQFDEKKMLL